LFELKKKNYAVMFKNTFQSGFISILYSVGSKPLKIWDKKVRLQLALVFYYRATDVTCINTDKLIKVCQSQRAGKRDRTLDTKTNLQLKVELHLLYI